MLPAQVPPVHRALLRSWGSPFLWTDSEYLFHERLFSCLTPDSSHWLAGEYLYIHYTRHYIQRYLVHYSIPAFLNMIADMSTRCFPSPSCIKCIQSGPVARWMPCSLAPNDTSSKPLSSGWTDHNVKCNCKHNTHRNIVYYLTIPWIVRASQTATR